MLVEISPLPAGVYAFHAGEESASFASMTKFILFGDNVGLPVATMKRNRG